MMACHVPNVTHPHAPWCRELYQQQLGNIHTTRRQQEMLIASGSLASRGGGTLGRTITDTVKMGADLRKLDKFEQQQQVWDGVTYSLAGRTGRPLHDLAMQRGHTWRTRAELVDLLHRAQPMDVRTNPEIWNMSLRDAWERIIPLGSIFSGLAVVIKVGVAPEECSDLISETITETGRRWWW
jgi:hypothetical protein